VVYSDTQRVELEKEYHFNRYITINRKSELARILGLSERQVNVTLVILMDSFDGPLKWTPWSSVKFNLKPMVSGFLFGSCSSAFPSSEIFVKLEEENGN